MSQLTTLGEGLKNNPVGKPADWCAEAITNIAVTLAFVSNPTTRHDLGVAVEDLLDKFGDVSELPDAYRAEVRPETDDTRPLYQRIDDEATFVGTTIKRNLGALELVAYILQDEDVRNEYWNAYLSFGGALGLPMAGEYDPADHPNVGPSTAERLFGAATDTEAPAA